MNVSNALTHRRAPVYKFLIKDYAAVFIVSLISKLSACELWMGNEIAPLCNPLGLNWQEDALEWSHGLVAVAPNDKYHT